MADSLYPEFDSEQLYVIGNIKIGTNRERYECGNVEMAIAKDDAAMIRECVERGWVTPAHRTLFNDTVRHRCKSVGALTVEAELARLGFPA